MPTIKRRRQLPGATSPRRAADGALVDALAQTSFVVMNALSRVGARNDLSLTQLRVFGILRDRRARMAELADYLGLDKSTLSGLVDRAEQRGLLTRTQNANDARVFEISMTAKARTMAARVHGEISAALAPLLEKLGNAERRRLSALLETIVE
jgi:DNA-binding MarR family transcriptional regulator